MCECLILGSFLPINCVFQHLEVRSSRKQADRGFTPLLASVIGSSGELAAIVDYSSVDLLDGQ